MLSIIQSYFDSDISYLQTLLPLRANPSGLSLRHIYRGELVNKILLPVGVCVVFALVLQHFSVKECSLSFDFVDVGCAEGCVAQQMAQSPCVKMSFGVEKNEALSFLSNPHRNVRLWHGDFTTNKLFRSLFWAEGDRILFVFANNLIFLPQSNNVLVDIISESIRNVVVCCTAPLGCVREGKLKGRIAFIGKYCFRQSHSLGEQLLEWSCSSLSNTFYLYKVLSPYCTVSLSQQYQRIALASSRSSSSSSSSDRYTSPMHCTYLERFQ